MLTFTLKDPRKDMSLRIEVSGKEKVTEIRRIASEFWMEDGFVLRNGCTVLKDNEKVSDVILNDDTIFIMECNTVQSV